jgi:hypothetical protein
MSGDFSQGEPPANTGRDQAGRFRKGHSGNPRSPKPGYRHKATMAAEKLLFADIEEIAKTVVREAKAGAHWRAGW